MLDRQTHWRSQRTDCLMVSGDRSRRSCRSQFQRRRRRRSSQQSAQLTAPAVYGAERTVTHRRPVAAQGAGRPPRGGRVDRTEYGDSETGGFGDPAFCGRRAFHQGSRRGARGCRVFGPMVAPADWVSVGRRPARSIDVARARAPVRKPDAADGGDAEGQTETGNFRCGPSPASRAARRSHPSKSRRS